MTYEYTPGPLGTSGELYPERPMPEAKTGEAVQLLDLMVEYFEDDAPWIRGQFYDGYGRRCLVGAIHYLSRKTPPLAGLERSISLNGQ